MSPARSHLGCWQLPALFGLTCCGSKENCFPDCLRLWKGSLLFSGYPLVIDLDDALFHTYDEHPSLLIRSLLSRKIDVVLSRATAVTVGNDYIAERACQAGARRVVVVPTTVDDRAYAKVESDSPATNLPSAG